MNGFLLVDKPTGISSFGTVQQLNKRFSIQKNAKKIGHGGTLDPNASGLLVIAVGKATRLLRFFLGSDKRYTAQIQFGSRTTTDDSEGEVIAEAPYEHITEEAILEGLHDFRGTILQIPPTYSALHIDGKRAYELARKGHEVQMSPRQVHIDRIDMTQCHLPTIELDIACSGGTYIRSIARDLGKRLHSEAHLSELRRTEACHFSVRQAHTLEFLMQQESIEPYLLPIDQGMHHFNRIDAKHAEVHKLLNGLPANFNVDKDGIYALWFKDQLVAMFERIQGKNDFLRLMSAQEFDDQFGRKS
ncbi:MAG: tRNA pseudouridine(55) synthase TruB [Proteobacteria bacterium]|nr:tRNA pseudouridine(55) synthase TruB [Pseudomonadota bacterium]